MCSCKVLDDGCGLSEAALELFGERYCTSKLKPVGEHEPNAAASSSGGGGGGGGPGAQQDSGIQAALHALHTYGFRGEALASLVELCACVRVSSAQAGDSFELGKGTHEALKRVHVTYVML